RAQGRPAGPDPLRGPRCAALGAIAAAGPRLSGALSHARRLRRGAERGALREAAGPLAAARRVLGVPPAGRPAAPRRPSLARQPPRAAAPRHQRAGVFARAAPRFRRAGAGPAPGPVAGRARHRRSADRSAPRQAFRAAARGARTGDLRRVRRPAHRDRAQAGRDLRRDLRRRRAPVPDGAVPRAWRRSRPDGRRAVRARRDAPQGAPAHEPARAAPARPAGSLRVIALCAVLLAAGAAEPGLKLLREGRAAEPVEAFSAALRKDPRNASLANDLGLANVRTGARAEAERNFRLAIQLRPRRSLAYGNLADLLSTAEDRWERADEILALLERGVAFASGEAKATLSLRVAAFEVSVGRTAQARK